MSLSESISALCEEIVRSENERKQSIIQIVNETSDLLTGFRKERDEIRNELFEAFNIWRRFSMERQKSELPSHMISSAGKGVEPVLPEEKSRRKRSKT